MPTERVYWLLFNFLQLASTQLQWKLQKTGNGNNPKARRDAAIGYDKTDQKIVLFGGRSAGSLGDTWIYNITANSWREVSSQSSPEPRSSMVYGTSGDYLYIATGEKLEPKRSFYDDIWRFNFRSETWKRLASPSPIASMTGNTSLHTSLIPGKRYGAAGGIYPGGNRFYVNQGYSDERYFDTYTFDVDKLDWHLEYCRAGHCNPYDPRYPHARCLHAGAMIATDVLLIYGGCLSGGGTGGPCPSSDTWVFDAKSLDWVRIKGCPAPRMYGSMALLPVFSGRKRVLMYGGIENGPQVIKTTASPDDVVAIFDVEEKLWTIRKTLADSGSYPTKRASVAMVTGEDGVFVYGGIELDSENVMSDLWLLQGDSDTADQSSMLQCPQHFVSMAILHGIFMVIGWGFLLQWGLFLARYFRSSKHRMWLFIHVTFQVLGMLFCIAGFIFAILSVQIDHFKFAHGTIGLVVMVLGILQPINAALRPDNPDTGEQVSRRRRLWEWLHHSLGQATILLAFINISLGVFMVVSITLLWAIWFGYFCVVLVAYLVAETFLFCRREPVNQSFLPSRSIASKKRFISAYSNPTVEQESERL